MATTAKEIENKGLKRGYKVTVEADNIAKRKKTRLAEIALTVTLKGFRKGKAPLNVVEAQYGDAIMGEILEAVVNAESQKVLNDNKIKPASQPKNWPIQSMNGPDATKVNWKSPKRMARKIGIPSHRLSTTSSILSEMVSLSIGGFSSTSFSSPLMKPYLASAMTVSASSPRTFLKWARLSSLACKTSSLANSHFLEFLYYFLILLQ